MPSIKFNLFKINNLKTFFNKINIYTFIFRVFFIQKSNYLTEKYKIKLFLIFY